MSSFINIQQEVVCRSSFVTEFIFAVTNSLADNFFNFSVSLVFILLAAHVENRGKQLSKFLS